MGSTRARRRRAGADSTNTAPPVAPPPLDTTKQPYLIVIAGGNIGELYKISKRRTLVGRAPGADLRIREDGVSREHLELVHEHGALVLRDLASSNGTYLNGARVEAAQIADGDKISLGATTVLKFSYQDGIDEQYEQRLYRSAVRDGLTQALKREVLLERLGEEIAFATRHAVCLALILWDLDRFKSVNDRLGHPAGDRVLQEVSATVSAMIRQEDVFGRYGGEEFAIVCRSTSPEQALQTAERIRIAIEQMVIEVDGACLKITASFGVAMGPVPGVSSVTELIGAADAALLRAKAAGRNRVEAADAAEPVTNDDPTPQRE